MEPITEKAAEPAYTFANSVNLIISPHDLWLRFSIEQPSDGADSQAIEVARIVMPVRLLEPLIEKLQGLAADRKASGDAD
jgi:hypothetical protein